MGGTAYAGRIRALGATLCKKNERQRAKTGGSEWGSTLPESTLNIPHRGALTESNHDAIDKRITAKVTDVTAETDVTDPTVSFDQLINRFSYPQDSFRIQIQI